jgi:D-alanyl-D-alanine carboxypeptidase
MRVTAVSAAFMMLATFAGSERVAAGPAVLFDAADGKILYAEDLDNQWHPASLTKIMTAYLVFEAVKEGKLQLKQKIPYSANAQQQPPSKLGLSLDAQLLVDSALKALIIKSANDVAIALAEAVSGSEQAFVAKMNDTARRLGMTRTNFVNPNGLPAPEQMTTARDLARLARAELRDYPEYGAYWSMSDARIGKIFIGSHNGLLRSFEGADGTKTGFICDSGYNVVASATRDGRKLMAVVLGETSGADRTIRAASLLEHGFQQYGWKTLFTPSSDIDTMPVAADAKGVTNMKQMIAAWECGNGRKPRVRKARGNKAAKKPQAADASATTGAATTSAAAVALPTAKPAPKPIQASATGASPSLKLDPKIDPGSFGYSASPPSMPGTGLPAN